MELYSFNIHFFLYTCIAQEILGLEGTSGSSQLPGRAMPASPMVTSSTFFL